MITMLERVMGMMTTTLMMVIRRTFFSPSHLSAPQGAEIASGARPGRPPEAGLPAPRFSFSKRGATSAKKSQARCAPEATSNAQVNWLPSPNVSPTPASASVVRPPEAGLYWPDYVPAPARFRAL